MITNEQKEKFFKALEEGLGLLADYNEYAEEEDDAEWTVNEENYGDDEEERVAPVKKQKEKSANILKYKLDSFVLGVQTNEYNLGNFINVFYDTDKHILAIEIYGGASESEIANEKMIALFNEVHPAGMAFREEKTSFLGKGNVDILGRVEYFEVALDDLTEKFSQFKKQFAKDAVWFDLLSVMKRGVREGGGKFIVSYDD